MIYIIIENTMVGTAIVCMFAEIDTTLIGVGAAWAGSIIGRDIGKMI